MGSILVFRIQNSLLKIYQPLLLCVSLEKTRIPVPSSSWLAACWTRGFHPIDFPSEEVTPKDGGFGILPTWL